MLKINKKVLTAVITLSLILPAFPVAADVEATKSTAAEPTALKGSETVFGQYWGTDGKFLFFEAGLRSWDAKNDTYANSPSNKGWQVSRDFKSLLALSPSECEKVKSRLEKVNPTYPAVKTKSFVVEKGTLKVDGLSVMKIPHWVDGTGDDITQVRLFQYPGRKGEQVYCVCYETLPKDAAPPHDYATRQMFIIKGQQVQVMKPDDYCAIITPDKVIPIENQGYLCTGWTPHYDPAAFLIRKDGSQVAFNPAFEKAMKLKPPHYAYALGIRGKQMLFFVKDDVQILNSKFYAMGTDLKVVKCRDSFEGLKNPYRGMWPWLDQNGTILAYGAMNEELYDLTHHRTLDLLAGKKVVGQYAPLGIKRVTLSGSKKTIEMPFYYYKGEACLCAEDFDGRGYKMTWNPATRKTDMTATKIIADKTPEVRPAGKISRSDVMIRFSGIPVESYNLGGYSLIPVESLKSAGVIR